MDNTLTTYEKLIEKLETWFDIMVLHLPNLAIAIVVAILAYFFTSLIRKLAIKFSRRFTENQTVLRLISNISAVIFSFLILFLVLSILDLGDTINKILATAGVLGLAVGLALQDPMTNLFSGIMLSVRELYNIDDLVETNGYMGTISDIDLRVTKLRLPTGEIVIIPNKDVIQNPLKNYTISGERRIDLACGISYGDNLERVESVVKEAIEQLPNIDHLKPVEFIYTDFGDSSINFKVRYWITNLSMRDFVMERSAGIKAIKGAFDANNIMIPFPIRTLDFGIKGGVALNEVINIKTEANKSKSN